MPDNAPDEIPGRLPRRMAGALVWLGAIGAAMLCAAGTFAYAGGWLPASRVTGGRLTQDRMMADLHDAGAGLFESAGQATALSRADMPVTARGMASRFLPPAPGQRCTGIDDIAMPAGNSAQGFYDRLMAAAPEPAVAKPDPARMELFPARHAEAVIVLIMERPVSAGFAASALDDERIDRFEPGRLTIDRVKRPGAVATQDAPAKAARERVSCRPVGPRLPYLPMAAMILTSRPSGLDPPDARDRHPRRE